MKPRFSNLLLASWLLSPMGAGHFISAQESSLKSSDSKQSLPLTEIVLYSSGVGYFQRDGQVNGNATVDLRFKAEDINDLLKSMIVQDFDGGNISTVSYGSRDPITKTLRSFAIDLTENPSLGQLLNQIRGERVEIMRPNPVSGTILGTEKKLHASGEHHPVEVEYVNLLTAEGLQSFPLEQIQRIKLVNERLNSELNQALAVLASSHDTQKKTVTITFDGQGQRDVAVAYIAQTPVWKTSYRLVLDEKEKPFLQGWAIVENTTDEDWKNVRLSLVSGRPISFTMDLYQPLYTTRPEIQPELYTSLRPQVYQDVMELADAPQAAPGGPATAYFSRNEALAAAKSLPSPAMAPDAAASRFGRRPMALGLRGAAASEAAEERNLQLAGLPAAEGAALGELFQYAIQTPVTLTRQNSAMLPIITQSIEGQKVSIYNQSVQSKHPLNGFRLRNSSSLHLMQGPVTVFDGGSYAGDARIEDLAPGQERLLSYALDLKTEVETLHGTGQQELVSVQIKKGTLIATRRLVEEKTYQLRNRDQKAKDVLIEHPFRADWNLVEPKKPEERTRESYRFALKIEPDKTIKLPVKEERQLTESVQLLNFGTDAFSFYLRAERVSRKVKEALQKIVTLRDQLNKTSADRSQREQRINEITSEQSRIRENMARLDSTTELFARYVNKLDEQETELESLRKEIEALKSTERQQQETLNDFLLNLDVE